MSRSLTVAAAFTLALGAAAPDGSLAQTPAIRLATPGNELIDPFEASRGASAVVFLFASVECPISNRYAPVVKRLHDRFSPQGVAFWLVYPNPAETPAQIREHLEAFGYPARALRDPKHDLVKLTGVTITPEAAVYDARRRLAYRGRIDDRYVVIGLERPAPTRHDLQDALAATIDGRAVAESRLQAVGCYIADFVQ